MKRLVKSTLYLIGLGRAGEKLYFNLRTLTPRVLATEVRVRMFGRDEQPVPPGRLIYDVIACRWADVYLRSGALLMHHLMDTLKAVGFSPGHGHRILDFGCGCGRLTRRLIEDTEAEIYGSDYNPELVSWCKDNLKRGAFSRNQPAPPLPYAAEMFDLVIARSVFTHLTEDLQIRWLAELRRVIKPGGLFYFSMHGPIMTGQLSEEQRKQFDAGDLVVTYREAEGENLCSSFAGPEFVRRKLVRGFELVRYEPGVAVRHLRQDVYVLRKNAK